MLEGDGARVLNGAVTGCQFAVLVEGTGNHLVTNVTASVQDPVLDDEELRRRVRVCDNGNRLVGNRVLLGGTNAIRMRRQHVQWQVVDEIENDVANNVIAGVGEGIEVRGASNWIRRNQIAGAIDAGMKVRSTGSWPTSRSMQLAMASASFRTTT